VCQGFEKSKEVGHRKLWSHPEPIPVSPIASSDSLPCCESRAGMLLLQTTPINEHNTLQKLHISFRGLWGKANSFPNKLQ
jgi:hypothetical protein